MCCSSALFDVGLRERPGFCVSLGPVRWFWPPPPPPLRRAPARAAFALRSCPRPTPALPGSLPQMSGAPAGSNARTSPTSSSSSSGSGSLASAPPAPSPGAACPPLPHLPPEDPLRQAKRLPIRLLKMLSAHGGHLLHPEYLQPLSSTPVSPIEVSAAAAAAGGATSPGSPSGGLGHGPGARLLTCFPSRAAPDGPPPKVRGAFPAPSGDPQSAWLGRGP